MLGRWSPAGNHRKRDVVVSEEIEAQQPAVTVIIVNYNGRHHLPECLGSLQSQTFEDFDTVFVDNASTDGSVEFVRENFPEVKIIESDTNLGCGGGRNLGIRHAMGHGEPDYIALIDNDLKLAPGYLQALVDHGQANPEAGIMGGRVYYYDGPEIIWYAGGYVSPGVYAQPPEGINTRDDGSHDEPLKCDYVVGCTMTIRRETIEEIGLFDEDFFFEQDMEYSIRARCAGIEVHYVPDAKMWHKVSRISPGRSQMLARWRYRLRLIRKHGGPKDWAIFVATLPRRALRVLRKLVLYAFGRPYE